MIIEKIVIIGMIVKPERLKIIKTKTWCVNDHNTFFILSFDTIIIVVLIVIRDYVFQIRSPFCFAFSLVSRKSAAS